MPLCRLLLRQNWQRPLSVAAGALGNSFASSSAFRPPPHPSPRSRFPENAKFSALVGGGGAGADHGHGDEKKVESGGHLNTDEKDLEKPDASGSGSEETRPYLEFPKHVGRPDIRFHFDEKELASDESIWALYKRWCRHYEFWMSVRKRTPEEMKQNFNIFKQNARMVIEFNQECRGVMVFLEEYADGYQPAPLKYYSYEISPNDPSWIASRDDDEKCKQLIKERTKLKNSRIRRSMTKNT